MKLSAAELRYFTDLDHHDREALGAVDRADGRGVGTARYVRDADDPQAAELATTRPAPTAAVTITGTGQGPGG